MKSIIILGDGMSDHPVDRLQGLTPLQVANKPNMDYIAKQGRMGLLSTIPKGQSKGSAVANLSVLGYDPARTFKGRAVLEAASMGIELADNDVALRCNLISLDGNKIANHSAGHITSDEAAEIITTLDRTLGNDKIAFYPGVSYRHLLVLKGEWASDQLTCAPPHDHVGQEAFTLLPKAKTPEAQQTAESLIDLYNKAISILADHPINQERFRLGKQSADAIWTWSPGYKPSMSTFQERFGINGAVISAVDLVKGLGKYAGMDVIPVEGATGLWDTNYEGKAQAAVNALQDHDFVYVHVEATDEAGHAMDLELKIKCIEMLDSRLIGPILAGIKKEQWETAVAILPDHPTPVETGNHASDPVPVAILTPGIEADSTEKYDEVQATQGSLGLMKGDEFICTLLQK